MEEKHAISVEQSANEKELQETSQEDYVAPGVAVVRANTPRPLPFSLKPAKTELPLSPSKSSTDFPVEAPDAPPLPEDDEAVNAGVTKTEPKISQALRSSANEFIWLFEYALDMDPVHLNRPERLNGSAFAYGPAVLKGYRLVFEGLDPRTSRITASLDPIQEDQEEKEIWGILYRVPRRFTRSEHNEIPLLDKVHCAETFVSVEIKVRESYRQREISCVTYVASETARLLVRQLPEHNRAPETAYLTRLLQIARRQKLPATYVHTIEELVRPAISTATPLPVTPLGHNTEPLPVVTTAEQEAQGRAGSTTNVERLFSFWNKERPANMEHWLTIFAIYVSLLLICTLILALIQGLGFGDAAFNSSFSSLGIPGYAFLYGLAGGCISCVISLGRAYPTYPPTFVVLTWFVRPFLGAFLGALAYLILASGIILVSSQPTQHFAICSVICAIAGFFEGNIFLRKNKVPNRQTAE